MHSTSRGNKANFFASHASFANIILEAWYPQTRYKHVQLAVVSKALTCPATKLVPCRKSLHYSLTSGGQSLDLDRRLRDCGAQEVPMYVSSCIINWKIGSATATLLLNIYVDGLALCGGERCHPGFLDGTPAGREA